MTLKLAYNETIIECVSDPSDKGKVFNLLDGDTEIETVMNQNEDLYGVTNAISPSQLGCLFKYLGISLQVASNILHCQPGAATQTTTEGNLDYAWKCTSRELGLVVKVNNPGT
ncbi:hypothetical protein [Sinomonas susongensis]|uniref:hypothetical protein n=1 Tax=Sinomonas susongensis TaxID=1324851 RepID=UPI001109FFF7|nr:hypothetical protein [Sinomonas susongensis]